MNKNELIDALGLRWNDWISGRQILGRLSEEMRNVLLFSLAERKHKRFE